MKLNFQLSNLLRMQHGAVKKITICVPTETTKWISNIYSTTTMDTGGISLSYRENVWTE